MQIPKLLLLLLKRRLHFRLMMYTFNQKVVHQINYLRQQQFIIYLIYQQLVKQVQLNLLYVIRRMILLMSLLLQLVRLIKSFLSTLRQRILKLFLVLMMQLYHRNFCLSLLILVLILNTTQLQNLILLLEHNYKNPSKTQDLGHVEAQVTKGKKYYDKDGWKFLHP